MELSSSSRTLLFQSTLSVRRATPVCECCECLTNISIHALREESDRVTNIPAHVVYISIHALREESDSGHLRMRGHQGISIHALREESDTATRRKST